MFATSLALLAQEFHGRERGTAFGIWGATIGGAVAIGPLVGGALTEGLGWEWIFFVNVPIGIARDRADRCARSTSRATRAAGGVDWLGPGHVLRRALPAGVRADPRQRRGLGQRADRRAAGRRRRC